MRQAGYLAAAGIYALENNISRLTIDHDNAKIIANEISKLPVVEDVMPVETNIIVYTLKKEFNLKEHLLLLEKNNIKAVAFGTQQVRMVTHLDISQSMVNVFCERIRNISFTI